MQDKSGVIAGAAGKRVALTGVAQFKRKLYLRIYSLLRQLTITKELTPQLQSYLIVSPKDPRSQA